MNAREVIIGQDRALRALQGALKTGRLAHFYIFAGVEGTGKRTTARALAKALQCDGAPEGAAGRGELEFCAECPPCRQIEAGNYPDVLTWADRPRASWWSSGQSTRLYSGPLVMEEARRLRGEMSLAPALSERRIFIVDRADQMDTEPANCLLKMLEEPPGARVVVLLAENTGRLLPTILSRAVVVRFGLVEEEVISRWLTDLLPGLEPTLVARAAALAGGRPGWAHLFALNEGIVEAAEAALESVEKVASGDPYAPFWAPGILQSAARDWQRQAGEGDPGAASGGEQREGSAAETTTTDSQVAREYLPLLLNAILSFFRQATLHEGKTTEPGDRFERLLLLGPHFYGSLVPIVEKFLKRLAANVNIPLLLQLLCLEIAALGQKHSPKPESTGQ